MKLTHYIIIVPPLWLRHISQRLYAALSLVLLTCAVVFAVLGVNDAIPLGVGLAGSVVCGWGALASAGRCEG